MDSSGQASKHSKEDEERFARLFQQLDHNRDGKLDLQELRDGIKRLGLPSKSGTAQVCSLLASVSPTQVAKSVCLPFPMLYWINLLGGAVASWFVGHAHRHSIAVGMIPLFFPLSF